MAILTINPWAQTVDFTSLSGSHTFESPIRAYGRKCTRFGPSLSGTAAGISAGHAANGAAALYGLSNGFVTYHCRFDDLPDSDSEVMFRCLSGSNTRKYDTEIHNSGLLSVSDRLGTHVATGTTPLAIGQTYRIGQRSGNGTSAPYEIWLAEDGQPFPATPELSGTMDQGVNNFDRVQPGKPSNKFSQTVGMSYQDMVVDDAQVWGHYYVGVALPRANGSLWNATGSWADVDEHPHDDTATEVELTNVAGSRALALLTGGADMGIGASDTIPGVMAVNIRDGTRIGTSNEVAQITIKSGGATAESSGANLGLVGYVHGAKVQLTDPNGGGAWTRAAIDAMEIGGGPGANFAMYLTSVMGYVMFVPAASVGPVFRGSYEG